MNMRGVMIGVLCTLVAGCAAANSNKGSQGNVPLFKNLGSFHYPITTQNPLAQNYFDQGLILAYAFNHAEAHRSFTEAARLDPKCAMCYWGQALVLGPNINAPMESTAVPIAYEAVQKSIHLSHATTEKEQALIKALSQRYVPDELADRSALDAAYAEAMRQVRIQYPQDSTIGSLLGEALMDLHPWNFWATNGEAYAWTSEILTVLENTLATDLNHPLANHLYIHAVEASPQPERAVPSADRLRDLVPGAGHLVHMPGHIYIRVGRYRDAMVANQHATHADAEYLGHSHSEGLYPLAYVPHNHHFLWAAATKLGMKEVSLESALDTAAHVESTMLENPDLGATLQHFSMIPLYTKALFGQWDDILQESTPALPYPKGVWHYARGLAYLRNGYQSQAVEELVALRNIANDPALADQRVFGLNSVSQLLLIGAEILAGELAASRQHVDQARTHLEQAIQLEEGLTYTEPKDWYLPPRQVLGAVLLDAGLAAEAERVYREDLAHHPQSGWSLFGLKESLKAQGKNQEAEKVKAQFQTAWADADIILVSSRF
jgi:tetratricopeptide (TPR) repeat protein